MGLLGFVLLEGIEEERGGLLNHVLRHKDVDDTLDVDERSGFVVDERLSEFGALVRVETSNMLQERGVIGRVVDLCTLVTSKVAWGSSETHPLRVDDDLLMLTGLGEGSDHLVGNVGSKVDRESELCCR